MRYANQIKMIKSTATKKEAKLTTEQLAALKIKELEEKLAAALAAGGGGGGGAAVDDDAMRKLNEQMEEMKRKEEEYLRREREMEAQMAALKAEQKKNDLIRSSGPHLIQILDNPMTSGLIPTALPEGTITAGPKQGEHELVLRGTGVRDNHCTFINTDGQVVLAPVNDTCQCMVNGKITTEPTELKHNDRLRLAENNYFRFLDPAILSAMSPEQIIEGLYQSDFFSGC